VAAARTEAPEDQRWAALKREEPVLTEVSLEEAMQAGAEGFSSETKDS